MSTERAYLAAALTDVRRSYRLVQSYQRRLWDLLQSLDEVLSGAGLPFERWTPMNVWSPPKTGTRFFVERWAWDFIPAYQIGCEWQGTDAPKNLTRRVFVIATADTGYDATSQGEPDPAQFKPAEECATVLRVGLWTASTGSPDWNEALQARKAQSERESYTMTVEGTTYTCQIVHVDVADLVDETAVRTRVLEPIQSWLGTTRK